MKRLTYFDSGKWRLKIGDTEYSGKAVDRLAAYEETGLEPEKIEQLKGEVFGLKVDKQELEQYRALGPIDRLRELAQADREGRVTIEPKARKCPKCGKMRLFPRIDWEYYYCYSCKTQFTRKEAKVALRREQNDN